mgnify:CR=1 FL=1
MKIKLFYYYRWDSTTLEDFEKEINDFMATVEVLDVKFSGTPSSESFNSVAIVLVLYR